MTAAKEKSVTVRFNGRVHYGFKHDTPGFEATVAADGKSVTCVQDFEIGDEFDFPAEESDVVAGLIESGVAEVV
jgi:hypothetical protein